MLQATEDRCKPLQTTVKIIFDDANAKVSLFVLSSYT